MTQRIVLMTLFYSKSDLEHMKYSSQKPFKFNPQIPRFLVILSIQPKHKE